MRRREFCEVVGVLAVGSPLEPVSAGRCMPLTQDYTYLWWANGWSGRNLADAKVLCVQTGRYGLALDVESLRLLHLGAIAKALSYSDAVAQDRRVISARTHSATGIARCRSGNCRNRSRRDDRTA